MTTGLDTEKGDEVAPDAAPHDVASSGSFTISAWLTPLRTHIVTLTAGGAWLVWIGRKQWFIADEWAFITGRGLLPGNDLLAPHVQHWVSGPIVIYRVLLNVFGLHTYLPYLVTGVIVHLVVVHLAWRVAVRAGANAWCATFLAVLLLVASSSAPQAIHPFQITLNGSVAFGLGLLLLADRRVEPDVPWTVLTATVAVIGLTFSTASVPLIAVAALLLWLRQGLRVALTVFAPSGVVYLGWYQLVGREALAQGAGTPQISPETLRAVPGFTWRGLSAAVGEPLQLSHVFGGAALTLILVLAIVMLLHSARGPVLIAAAAAGSAGAFFSLTAIGRANLGATASRYLYVGAALLFPLVAVVLSRLWRRGAVAIVAIAIVLTPLIVLNARDLRRVALSEAATAQNLRRELLATAQVVEDNPDVPGRAVPQLLVNPDLTVSRLRSLIRSGWFPSERVNPASYPNVQRYPHITLSSRPEFPLGANAPSIAPGPQSSDVVAGCSRVPQDPDGQITLDIEAPSSVRVTTPMATSMKIWDADADGNARGMVVTSELQPGRPVYINLEQAGAIVIAPYFGRFTVCGLASEAATP